MSESAQRLAQKYKTTQRPTKQQILHFKMLVNQYIREGDNAEKAGQKAARKSFQIDETILRKSQGDTIEALLHLIESESRNEKL